VEGICVTAPVRKPAVRLLQAASLLALLALPTRAPAWETEDGNVALHGYYEMQLRWLSDDFDSNNWYSSQWANTLALELELNLFPDGIGPFDVLTGFVRVEGRYDCIFTGCGISGSHRWFGDRAHMAPARNWRDGITTGFEGNVPDSRLRERIHRGSNELLTLQASPLIRPLFDLGATNVAATFAPVEDDLFAFKEFDTTRDEGAFQMGPWNTESRVQPIGALRTVPNITLGLPMRPEIGETIRGKHGAEGLYVPSDQLLRHLDDFDDFDVNYSEKELAWNHGAGQDEHELREAYIDAELFDSRLWLRVGKQSIVWGKTELFRTTDQFNPQDLALSSLPSLEESRIPLWSARLIYSLYDLGPFEDVRLELAINMDDFEPIDLGRCGEPYTIWLVCGKSTALWAHGVTGLGLAGEIRPENPWHDSRGIEVGGRIEWRWDRFSFAITDFWGYSDSPVVQSLNFYNRNVDPVSGRPLDSRGRPLTPENAERLHPGNRQLFDVVCSATVGVAATLLPVLADACLLDLLNNPTPLGLIPPDSPIPIPDPSPALALGVVLAGSNIGQVVANALLTGDPTNLDLTPDPILVPLNRDPQDGPPSGFGVPGDPFGLGPGGIGGFLTDQQEGLLGCGPFYRTDCDENGIDLFNAEASVLIQSFPFNEPQPAVATRFQDGKLFVLPGARGPGDPGYDPDVDGTPPAGYSNELGALSANFARLLAVLGVASGTDPDCSIEVLGNCETVKAVLAVTGVSRPEIRAGGNGRFGRRDFIWLAGGEAFLSYHKRNVLGFSMDFAEDVTKTNWSFEFTWFDDDLFGSSTTRSLVQEGDAYNLTISVDRPTFVNFLNANRTLFMNAQLFIGYLPDYNRSYTVNGPISALGTFAVATGYFQDRLLPSLVFIYDFQSKSGGILPQVTYRVSQDFSITAGMAFFYGSPQFADVPVFQLAPANNGGSFRSRTSYQGLSAIAERDEVFLRIRYTF
jgi:hypothetical protein